MTEQDIENIRKYLKQHNLDLYEITVNKIVKNQLITKVVKMA